MLKSNFSLALNYLSCFLYLTCLCNYGACDEKINETVITSQVNNNIYRQKEILEPSGKFIVEWETDFLKENVIFDVTAQTTGFVAFGLSPGGGMSGADIVVGGIHPNGSSYFADYYGTGDEPPTLDKRQDWELLSAFENSTHTFLRFQRAFDPCDPQDVAITNDTVNFIWAYGKEDGLGYHHGVRGSVAVNPLDPPYPSVDVSKFHSWKLTVDMAMPNKSFSYWCTIHSKPKFSGKNHVVGFRPLLVGQLASKHTHHFVVYKCSTPPGASARRIFEPFADVPGDECYTAEAMRKRPSQLCDTTLYVWGVGGKEFFLPEHVGYPVGEVEDEYFMLEIHYDNPQSLPDIKFETGVEIFYTPEIRKYDAGMMTIGHTVLASLFIPPKTKDFMIVGHCGSQCTEKGVPESGINFFNVLLHTHLAGRKMKLRHFRNNTELPWLSYDDSYHFNYQKNRPLREERKVLRGDSLTFECTFDTSSRSDVTVAGYSTRNEMCEAFIWYYPKQQLEGCSSFYPIEKLYQLFGIKNVQWLPGIDHGAQPVVIAPDSMANKTFGEVLSTTVDWTPEMKAKLQDMLKNSDHEGVCNVKEKNPAPTYYTPFNLPPEPPKTLLRVPKLEHYYQPPARCIDQNVIPN